VKSACRRAATAVAVAVTAAGCVACTPGGDPGSDSAAEPGTKQSYEELAGPPASVLIAGVQMIDGTGKPAFNADVGISEGKITLVRPAAADTPAGPAASDGTFADTIDGFGLLLTPGFIDMHSHIDPLVEWGRPATEFITQGITTGVVGVDGGGTSDLDDFFQQVEGGGVGHHIISYVGHGSIRARVMGMDDRAPDAAELEQMRDLVRQGMREGAFGFSTGLFYTPGYYADTDEVVALGQVAAEFGGPQEIIYDTHDRDLGAAYQGIGYLNSIREAVDIGSRTGLRVIFSHFNAQGAANYGRAAEGAALIDSARAEGLEVAGAQHVYTSTMSSLRAYTIPRWAQSGGPEQMVRRFLDPDTAAILDVQTMEMLDIRGGPDQLVFADPLPELNGKTLAEVAAEREKPVPEVVRDLMAGGNPGVMNRNLYDPVNTRFLAAQSWMMTCTDGATSRPGQYMTHPRAYGAFPKKVREYVREEGLISMEFAVRSMTGLAADFLGLDDRGYVREGMVADIALIDPAGFTDRATYEDPHRYSEGVVHLLVNGRFAIRDGESTGVLAGRAIRRPTSG